MIEQLPGMYGGVQVPHYEQYTGVYAMPLERFDAIAAQIRAVNPEDHVSETRKERSERIAAGGSPRTTRQEAQLDAAGYELLPGGVAVVDLNGVMTKYGGSFSSMPGGVVGLRRTLRAAAADAQVTSIVLRVDSPGGSVAGTDDMADDVRLVNQIKPVVAYLEDIAASAAYYVASPAGKIVSAKGTMVGSIGVYMVVDDWSGAMAASGVKRHVIRSGPMKGAGVAGTEITPEQLADFQRTVDELHGLFVDTVAAGRKMTTEQVGKIADGRIHIASRAKELGLVDAIGTFEQAVAMARGMVKGNGNGQTIKVAAAVVAPQNTVGKEKTMSTADATTAATEPRPATLAELKKAIPDASAADREGWLELEATVADAKDLWMDKLRATNKAQAEEIAGLKSAAKKPGVAPIESGGTASGPMDETVMIEQAVAEAGGNYRKGLEKLQKRLVQPHLDAGLSVKSANARAGQQYPIVFGVAA